MLAFCTWCVIFFCYDILSIWYITPNMESGEWLTGEDWIRFHHRMRIDHFYSNISSNSTLENMEMHP